MYHSYTVDVGKMQTTSLGILFNVTVAMLFILFAIMFSPVALIGTVVFLVFAGFGYNKQKLIDDWIVDKWFRSLANPFQIIDYQDIFVLIDKNNLVHHITDCTQTVNSWLDDNKTNQYKRLIHCKGILQE